MTLEQFVLYMLGGTPPCNSDYKEYYAFIPIVALLQGGGPPNVYVLYRARIPKVLKDIQDFLVPSTRKV